MQLFRSLLLLICALSASVSAFSQRAANAREKVIIDTDIGDDIDDAFAVALALKCPELDILGFTTAFGDTSLRANLVSRLLFEAGRQDIPIAAGRPTKPAMPFTQSIYAKGGAAPHTDFPDAVDFILRQIRENPNQVTLIAIGPLVNVGALIDKDPATFRQLKQVVLMGGSVGKWSNGSDLGTQMSPVAEWNIVNDIQSAQKLFKSGVSIAMMPLDSTSNLGLDEVNRANLFSQATPISNALAALYFEWGSQTPVLYDPMTIAYLLEPSICPVLPMHIRVDEKGITSRENGDPNAMVCLHSRQDDFLRFYLDRVIGRTPSGGI
jgi:purine nucleosidase